MNCPACGVLNTPGSRFCAECGTALTPPPPTEPVGAVPPPPPPGGSMPPPPPPGSPVPPPPPPGGAVPPPPPPTQVNDLSGPPTVAMGTPVPPPPPTSGFPPGPAQPVGPAPVASGGQSPLPLILGAVAVVALIVAGFLLFGGDDGDEEAGDTTTTEEEETTTTEDEETTTTTEDEETTTTTEDEETTTTGAPGGGGGVVSESITLEGGQLEISLEWFAGDDFDVVVIDPDGERLSFTNTGPSATGGTHSGDETGGCGDSGPFVESTSWPDGAATGDYVIEVSPFGSPDCGDGSYAVTITSGSQVVEVTGTAADGNDDTIELAVQ